MDFEDLLTGKRRGKPGRDGRGGFSHDQDSRHEDYSRSDYGDHDDGYRGRREHDFDIGMILSKVRSLPHFKTLLVSAAVGGVLLLVLGVGLLMMLLPYFGKAAGYVSQNGLQNVVNQALPQGAAREIVKQVLPQEGVEGAVTKILLNEGVPAPANTGSSKEAIQTGPQKDSPDGAQQGGANPDSGKEGAQSASPTKTLLQKLWTGKQ
jgi:hypothetical protein